MFGLMEANSIYDANGYLLNSRLDGDFLMF